MFGLGSTELVVILVIILLIFGPKKLPALARSIGESIKSFRQGKELNAPKLNHDEIQKDTDHHKE